MKRFFVFSAAAALVATLALSLPADDEKPSDDMTVDPVCQMNIHKSAVDWKESFQGETYYFCNKNCHDLFLEKPTMYAGAVQYMMGKGASEGKWRVHYFSHPQKLFANTDMQVYFVVEKNLKDVTGKAVKCDAVSCDLVSDTGKVLNPKLAFQPLKEEGFFRTAARFGTTGRLNVRVRFTFDDGKSDEAEFKIPVLAGEDQDTGSEYDGKHVDMVIQHETMRKTGKYWEKAGLALEAGDMAAARDAFAKVKGYAKYVKDMVPHVHEDEDEELKKMAAEYAAALDAMEPVMKADDAEKAKAEWKKVDALQCSECHMKFRWATFSNRDSFPVEVGQPKK